MNIWVNCEGYYWGTVIYAPGGRCGPRVQNNLQLVVLHSGHLEVEIEGRLVAVQPGEAILLWPGRREFFQFHRGEESHHSWCEACGPQLTWQARQGEPESVVFPWNATLQGMLETGLVWMRDNRSAIRQAREALAAAVLWQAIAASGWKGAEKPLPESLQKCLQFIEAHCHEPLCGNDLSRAAGLSQQHLIRLCRQETGRTPMEELWRRREDRALDLLRNTGLAIKEVAARCGFQNAFHCSRRLRARMGMPPKEIRRRAWNGRLDDAP